MGGKMQWIFLDTDPVIALSLSHSLSVSVCICLPQTNTHPDKKKTGKPEWTPPQVYLLLLLKPRQMLPVFILHFLFCAHICQFFFRARGLWSRCSRPSSSSSSSSSMYTVRLQDVSGAFALAVRYRCWHFPVGEPHVAAAPGTIPGSPGCLLLIKP